jgi:RNA recognition motif-containing protein
MFRIYVGNLSFRTTPEALKAHFATFGEVLDAFIGTDRETGRSRGFGFVTMADKDAGAKAIAELNGKEFEGRALAVNEAQPRQERGPGGGGGRGGFGGGGGGGSRGGFGGGGEDFDRGPRGGRERGDRRDNRDRDEW